MPSEFKLDSMTKTCRCVIDMPFYKADKTRQKDFDLDEITDELKKNLFVYALIVHDKDTDKEGVLKKKHVHLVFECPKRHRLSYYLNRLTEMFNVGRDLISIQVSNSFDGDIQYLIHKHNEDKYQYKVTDIITNMSKEELDERLRVDIHKEITSVYLLDVVKNCRTKTDIQLKLGLGIYNLYYKCIDDFIKDGWLGYNLREHTEGEIDRIFG